MFADLQDSVIYVAGDGIAWLLAALIAGAFALAVMRIANGVVRAVMRWDD